MYKRFGILLLLLGSALSSFAGEVENVINSGANLMLYLYTPQCGYCRQFDARYNKITKVYDNKFKFIKIDANTDYGKLLMYNYNAYYVPYVLLTNKKKTIRISPDCLLNSECIDRAVAKF